MHISDTGLKLIQEFEGCPKNKKGQIESYKDPIGIWTIGFGHIKGVKQGQIITREQAIEYLKQDIVTAENAVDRYMSKYNFNQNQYDALVSFAFNLGGGNIDLLTAKGSRTIQRIAEKIPAYNKADGKVLDGLTRRRLAEQKLFNTPVKANNKAKTTTATTINNKPQKKVKTIDEIAQMVIEGKYGNGYERKNRLKKAGYDYQEVQNAVNNILFNNNKNKKITVYIIRKGDTLTSIAQKFNTTVKDIQAKNNISNPNKIYEGKKIYV